MKDLNSACLFGSWPFAFDLQFWCLFQISHMVPLCATGLGQDGVSSSGGCKAESTIKTLTGSNNHLPLPLHSITSNKTVGLAISAAPLTTQVSPVLAALNLLSARAWPMLSQVHSFREGKSLFPSSSSYADRHYSQSFFCSSCTCLPCCPSCPSPDWTPGGLRHFSSYPWMFRVSMYAFQVSQLHFNLL